MPTYSHPTGNRTHLMNVYTNKNYLRLGIAKQMVSMLIEEAKSKGATEISLDATEEGRPLYKILGFTENKEAMVLEIQ
jgi:ribosomal protein S18 acetylase RimI-like enzyme